MKIHFADAWEEIADVYPNRTAAICDGKLISWKQFNFRASQVASLLHANGLAAGSKIAVYSHNSNQCLEIGLGAFKIGACPVYMNYRYKADELVYLLENSDAEIVFFQACYAMRVWEIKDRLTKVKVLVQIDDGTEALLKGAADYERSIRSLGPMGRSKRDSEGDYILYTGGTTGLPKGVVYSVASFAGRFVDTAALSLGLEVPNNIDEYRDFLSKIDRPPVSLPCCPLMHGPGMWYGCFLPLLMGGSVVTTSSLGLNPDVLLSMVEQYRVTDLILVGDSFSKPLLDSLDFAEKRRDPFDLRTLERITSSGAIWSHEVKEALLRHHDMSLIDILGSAEGNMGRSVTTRENISAETAVFVLDDGVVVVSEEGDKTELAVDEIGELAISGLLPIGYYKDPRKSDRAFVELKGTRYALSGDYVAVEHGGMVKFLGRGSGCIKTPEGVVFPEEVEEMVKKSGGVADCLVVGVPDTEHADKIIAIVSIEEETEMEESFLHASSKKHLSEFKVPRGFIFVNQVRRGPNGKGDYKWAKELAVKNYE